MRRWTLALISLLLISGCGPDADFSPDPVVSTLFGPTAMRIHPIFTQVKDWTGDGKPDGIEALIEFQDQFDDPTKASGRAIFELFEYRRDYPDPRGPRVANPWIGSLVTLADQRERWNRTSRTYSFQLAMPDIATTRSYVLSATFEQTGGGRFFDRVILQPQVPETPAPKAPMLPMPTAPQEPRSAEPASTQPARR